MQQFKVEIETNNTRCQDEGVQHNGSQHNGGEHEGRQNGTGEQQGGQNLKNGGKINKNGRKYIRTFLDFLLLKMLPSVKRFWATELPG